ncbi:hypothetical protein J132_09243 [Termitomyces sp. J132]|nr:hypothetical protein J132_09243 [Termitomyces sp. J132]
MAITPVCTPEDFLEHPNPTYLPPTHYYAYPTPAAVPTPEQPDNYSSSQLPFPTQIPSSSKQQQVKAYV